MASPQRITTANTPGKGGTALTSAKVTKRSGVTASKLLSVSPRTEEIEPTAAATIAAKGHEAKKGHLEVGAADRETFSNLIHSDHPLLNPQPPAAELKKAVEKNDGKAQFAVGEYFLKEHDVSAACSWFAKAHESSDSQAQQAARDILTRLGSNKPASPAACYKLAEIALRHLDAHSSDAPKLREHMSAAVKWLGATVATESRNAQWIDASIEELRTLITKRAGELHYLLENGDEEGAQNLKGALYALCKRNNPLYRQETCAFLDQIISQSKNLNACLRAAAIGQHLKAVVPHAEPWSNFKSSLERKSSEFIRRYETQLMDQNVAPDEQVKILKQYLDLIAAIGLSASGEYQSQAVNSLKAIILKSPEQRERLLELFAKCIRDKHYSVKAWISIQGILQAMNHSAAGNGFSALFDVLTNAKAWMKDDAVQVQLARQPGLSRDLLDSAARLIDSAQGAKFKKLGTEIKVAASDIIKKQLGAL